MKTRKFLLIFCIFLLISRPNSNVSSRNLQICNPSTPIVTNCDLSKCKEYEKQERKLKKMIEKRIEEYLKKVNQNNDESPKKCKKIKDFSFVDVAEDNEERFNYNDLDNEQENLDNINSMLWTGRDLSLTSAHKEAFAASDQTEIAEETTYIKEEATNIKEEESYSKETNIKEEGSIVRADNTQVEEEMSNLKKLSKRIQNFLNPERLRRTKPKDSDQTDLSPSSNPVDVVIENSAGTNLSQEDFGQNSSSNNFAIENKREIFAPKIILCAENVYLTNDLINVTEFKAKAIHDKRDNLDKTIDEMRKKKLDERGDKENIEATVKRLNAINDFFYGVEDPDIRNDYYKKKRGEICENSDFPENDSRKRIRDRKMAELFHKKPPEKKKPVEIKKEEPVEADDDNSTYPEMFMKQIQSFFQPSEETTGNDSGLNESTDVPISDNQENPPNSVPEIETEQEEYPKDDEDYEEDDEIAVGGDISFEFGDGEQVAETFEERGNVEQEVRGTYRNTLVENSLLIAHYMAKIQQIVKSLIMIGVACYVLSLVSRWINHMDSY